MRANLEGADLTSANLSQVFTSDIDFSATNLTNLKLTQHISVFYTLCSNLLYKKI
ncbi:MAG: pentapeptide repeat-containing protein [Nostoc sp.]